MEEPPWCTCALQDPSYLHPIVFGPPETLLWPLDSGHPPRTHTHTHTCVTCQNLDVLLPRLDIGGSAETFLLLAVLQFQPNQIPSRIQNFAPSLLPTVSQSTLSVQFNKFSFPQIIISNFPPYCRRDVKCQRCCCRSQSKPTPWSWLQQEHPGPS